MGRGRGAHIARVQGRQSPRVDPCASEISPRSSLGQNGLWWALVLGADLGDIATAIGASANVVVVGMAKRSGHPISFWEFTKYGSLVAVVTLGIATPYLLLRY